MKRIPKQTINLRTSHQHSATLLPPDAFSAGRCGRGTMWLIAAIPVDIGLRRIRGQDARRGGRVRTRRLRRPQSRCLFSHRGGPPDARQGDAVLPELRGLSWPGFSDMPNSGTRSCGTAATSSAGDPVCSAATATGSSSMPGWTAKSSTHGEARGKPTRRSACESVDGTPEEPAGFGWQRHASHRDRQEVRSGLGASRVCNRRAGHGSAIRHRNRWHCSNGLPAPAATKAT